MQKLVLLESFQFILGFHSINPDINCFILSLISVN